MTTFRVNPNDPSYVIKLNKGATSATDGRIPFWGPPVPKASPAAAGGSQGQYLRNPTIFGDDTIANVPGIDPYAEPVPEVYVREDQTVVRRFDDLEPEMIPAQESMWRPATKVNANLSMRIKGTRPTGSYAQLKESNNLVGGWQDFLGNSAPRGVFANYAGTTRKFNSHPQTTQTMARLAIPISGDPYDFITKSGLGATLGPLANSIIIQGNSGLGYIDFLLQNIQESFSEKVQVSDTIGDNYAAFFFGMSPPTFSFAGQFLNTYQDDWRAAFHLLYRNLLRGTMLARRNLILSLYYDNIIITGYMLNHNQQYTAEMQMASNFSFNMLVKNMTIFRLPGTMPTQADRLPSDIGFKTFAGVQRAAIQRTSRVVNVVATETLPVKGGECNKDVGSGYSAYGFGSTEDARYLKSEKDEAPSQPGLRSASDPSVAIDIANDVYNESAVANMFSDWQNPIQGIPAPSI